ncbi:alpha/beta fold hydrolase [Mesorhizobium sp. INR15]|uniref:alpha/beta fold hydrolase n=1 Tax=Mesorhizobium sp. INR15 TaxID=2654248 RepID=UPI0018968D66|nr:alpha/beta hydrolase [Mesorhizobium sp. INR15]QPC95525.1 alpha/beta fold hydrolase [Mesorhizobium sp. INR15]
MIPLLLIPGMMCDARLFGPQIAGLSAQRNLILASIASHDTIAKLAAEILAHSPPRFALVGLSMGGIVAMEIIRQAPGRVERLALLDTNPLPELEAVRQRREPQIEKVRAGGLHVVMRDEMIPNYLTNGHEKQAIADLCMDMAVGLGSDVFIRQSRALQTRAGQEDVLRTVTVPSLILCGEEDALCPVERHIFMRDLIAGARLEVIEHAGHLPTLEKPEQTTAALSRWLEA